MSLVSAFNIAREAMNVSQAGITVVSNNIANIDTEGYSKLRVDQTEIDTVYSKTTNSAIIKAEALSGVDVQSVTRYSNSFLQSYYWDKNSDYSYSSQYASSASQIEDVVNELNDTGLTKALSDFYTAANALNKTPSDKTLRSNYLSAAQNVASAFNTVSSSLSNIRETLIGTPANPNSSSLSSNLDSANSLLDQLAAVNQSIRTTKTSDGTASSALLDKRDNLITSISKLVNVTTSENKDGTMNVSLGGNSLVYGSNVVNHFSGSIVADATSTDPTAYTAQVNLVNQETGNKTDVTSDITAGSVGAIIDVSGPATSSNLTINGLMSQVDGMASSFASVLNKIQTTTDANGTPMALNSTYTALQAVNATDVIFKTSDGSATINAANITINSDLVTNPYKLAAARVTNIADTTATGNNSNLKQVIAARTDASYYAGTAISGSTLENNISTFVTSAGTKISNINSAEKTDKSVLSQVKTNLTSETSVSLNEELSDMLKYQQAYQAAARVFSTCNDLMETMVNLGK